MTQSYYFDADAPFWNDWFNDCTSVQRPCRTMKTLNDLKLVAGDAINLKGNFVALDPPRQRPLSGEGLAIFLILAGVILVASIVKIELRRRGKWIAGDS